MSQLPHDHGKSQEVLLRSIPAPSEFQTMADTFKLLSDGTRLRLFWILCHCTQCVANLSAMMDMSSPALSHHLKLLKDAGLICSHREGKEVYYTASNLPATRILHDALESVMAISCPSKNSKN